MNISSIQQGDLVEVDKNGRVFIAFVEQKAERCLNILPLNRHESYRTADAREVKKWWRKMGRPRPRSSQRAALSSVDDVTA